MERASTCAFTGHRENKLPWRGNEADARCLRLKNCIFDAVEAVYQSGIRHYICGMANGCDLYFAEAVLLLRAEHPEVTLEAAIPCEGQSSRWTAAQRRQYDRLIQECDYCTVIQQHYSPDCMQRRNRYMVDAAAVLIAAYNGSPGGTRSTLLYAMRQGLQIIELPVEDDGNAE